jgi:heparin/heparan-sulfate lyase
MIHFYGDSQPEKVSLAKWMLTKVKKQKEEVYPFARFLLTHSHEEIPAKGPSATTPKARHFKNMGQLFMRSGSGQEDTYALFTAGGILRQHRHYDNNNFIIYHKGFLALDTGSRPQPGLHLTHYYCRTMAHNCILIQMPGETMPKYWGEVGFPAPGEALVPVPNDGGQNDLLGSEIKGFDENPYYVYVASDATKSYHSAKAGLVLRQFVFLPPDHFVVFDRVVSLKPEYKKTWLLHTASEPKLEGNVFFADQDQGRIFCKTLFPEKAQINKIGGPGKQFWSGGQNWPIPDKNPDTNFNQSNTREMLGQWRMEISPAEENSEDLFLHLIQVGDRSLSSMVETQNIRTQDSIGIKFRYNQFEYELQFNNKGPAGGHIVIKQNGNRLLQEDFSQEVKSQKGLF